MSKRVALIGNMNNNFFPITRHLRDRGYDAQLFYRVGMDHFQPKADTYSLGYTEYCTEVTWLKNGFHNVDVNKVKEQLSGFDFYIGQGEEAAVAYKCGFDMDVYYPYGSDVSKYSYLPQEYSTKDKILSFLRTYKKNRVHYGQMKEGTMAKYQRGVIVNAKHLLAERTNDDFLKKLNALEFKGKLIEIGMPFIYPSEYLELLNGLEPDVHWRSEIKKMRAEYDFILLYHGRQEWKSFYNEFNGKNTDHLIQGFAEFLKKNKTNVCLAMLEYGNDVHFSKELVKELGIEGNVRWFPSMYRKDLMYLINSVDICSGEFAKSYLTFGTVVEAMLLQKPVIHHRQDDLYKNLFPELYPLLNARASGEIAEAIDFAYHNKQAIHNMGTQAQSWVLKYFIGNALDVLDDLIKSK